MTEFDEEIARDGISLKKCADYFPNKILPRVFDITGSNMSCKDCGGGIIVSIDYDRAEPIRYHTCVDCGILKPGAVMFTYRPGFWQRLKKWFRGLV